MCADLGKLHTQCGKTRNSLSPKNISSNQLFRTYLLISKNRYFHEIFAKTAWENIPVISTLCCGNHSIFLSQLFAKILWNLLYIMKIDFTNFFKWNTVDYKQSLLQELMFWMIVTQIPTDWNRQSTSSKVGKENFD